MKVNVFYSWQSDLSNNTNRGFIECCLEKALKKIYQDNKAISEYKIESDSRDESGTPDIISSIFSKIDNSDIFVADISIINRNSDVRKTPNPNVLVELGYAASVIGWENILCVFNDDYGKKEELPFDIRFRKPIGYSTLEEKLLAKKKLTSSLQKGIQQIIENKVNDKKFYSEAKREIDLMLQAILLDFLKMFYFSSSDYNSKRWNYNKLLHFTVDDIIYEIKNKKFLGFQLFKDQEQNVTAFSEFFNDKTKIYFFNEKEIDILAKIIWLLRDLKNMFGSDEITSEIGVTEKYSLIDAHKMNSENAPGSMILLEKIDQEQGVVKDSGIFKKHDYKKLTILYMIKPERVNRIAHAIINLTTAINDWIRHTGGTFIFNHRQFME